MRNGSSCRQLTIAVGIRLGVAPPQETLEPISGDSKGAAGALRRLTPPGTSAYSEALNRTQKACNAP